MANETLIEGRCYTAISVETAYETGTPAFPGDEVHTYDATPDRKHNPLIRQGTSAQATNFGAETGMATYKFTGTHEFYGLSVADNASVPRNIGPLAALGFTLGATTPVFPSANYDAGPPQTIYTELSSVGPISAAILHREENRNGGAGIQWLYNGVRATGTINFPANEIVTLEMEYTATSLTRSAYTAAPPALTFADSESECRRPLVNMGTGVTIRSAETTPTYTLAAVFRSGSIDLNRGITVTPDPSQFDGNGRTYITGENRIKGQLVIEVPPDADFNFYAAITGKERMVVALAFTPPDDVNETVTFEWFCQFHNATESFEDGVKIATIEFEGINPDSGRDGAGGIAGLNEDSTCTPHQPNLRITYSQGS